MGNVEGPHLREDCLNYRAVRFVKAVAGQSTVCDKWMICDLPTCLKHIKNLKGFTTTMVEIVVLFKPAVFTRTSTEKRQTLWIEWEQALVISAF